MADNALRLVIQVDDQGTAVVKRFTGGVGQASDQLAKRSTSAMDKVRASVGRMQSGFRVAQTVLLGFAAALPAAVAGGVAALTVSVANSNAALEEMGRRLGVSTEFLSAMGYAAQQEGVRVEAMNIGLQRAQRRLAEAAQGGGEAKAAFEELGIATRDTAGNARSIEQVFPEIAQALSQVGSESDRTRLAFKIFDSEGVALLQTMSKGREGLEAYTARAQALGIVVSGEAARASKVFTGNMTDLTGALRGAGMSIANELIPFIGPLIGHLADLVTRWGQSAVGAIDFADVAATALSGVVKAGGFLLQTFTVIMEGWNRLGEAAGVFADLVLRYYQGITRGAAAVAKALGLEGVGQGLDQVASTLGTMRQSVLNFADRSAAAADAWKGHRALIGQMAGEIQGTIQAARDTAKTFGEDTKAAGEQGADGLKKTGEAAETATDKVTTLDEAFQTFGLKSAKAVHDSLMAMEADYAQLLASGEATNRQLLQAAEQIAQAYEDAGGRVGAAWERELKRLRDATGVTAARIQAEIQAMGDANTARIRDSVTAQIDAILDLGRSGDLSAHQVKESLQKLWLDAKAGGQDTFGRLVGLIEDWREQSRQAAQAVAQSHQQAAVLTLESWAVVDDTLKRQLDDLVIEKRFATTARGIREQIRELEQARLRVTRGARSVAEAAVRQEQIDKQLAILRDRLADLTETTSRTSDQAARDTADSFTALERSGTQSATALADAHTQSAGTVARGYRDAADDVGRAMRSLSASAAAASQDVTASVSKAAGSVQRLRQELPDAGGGTLTFDPANPPTTQLRRPGFQFGGQFTVGGRGGPDSQLVQFRASPGERVVVQPPSPAGGQAPSVQQHLTIGQLTVTSPRIADADGLVRELTPALRRAQRRGDFDLGRP